MAPLQIVLNAQPLATQVNALHNEEDTQKWLRSANYSAASSIQFYMETASRLKLYSNQFSSKFYQIKMDSPLINNAYTYFQNITAKNVSAQTMWFATGKNFSAQLTPQQTEVYNLICRHELLLRNMMKSQGDITGLPLITQLTELFIRHSLQTTSSLTIRLPQYQERRGQDWRITQFQSANCELYLSQKAIHASDLIPSNLILLLCQIFIASQKQSTFTSFRLQDNKTMSQQLIILA